MLVCVGRAWSETYILAHKVQIDLLSHLFEHLVVAAQDQDPIALNFIQDIRNKLYRLAVLFHSDKQVI